MSDSDRLHALDAVRGFALLLGVVLHATMSFILPVPALDSSQSTTLAVVFFVIHIFRMSLFYLIAGFFARLVLERKGSAEFLSNRVKRILVPLVAGWVILFPATLIAIAWGVTRSAANIEAAGFDELMQQDAGGFPLLHLWFLYYLLWFYLIAVGMTWFSSRLPDLPSHLAATVDRIGFSILARHWGPLVLSVPVVFVLLPSPDWILYAGIPTPDSGFRLQLPATLSYGLAFGAGWLAHRQIGLLDEWKRRWRLNTGLAIMLSVGAILLLGQVPDWSVRAETGANSLTELAYAISYCAAIWYWSFGLLGMALQFLSEPSGWRRYLADSSYWLYLVHLPLIFFLQALVSTWPLHWSFKFAGILTVATVSLLLSYHYLVRSTWIGAWLNGRRYPKIPASG